MPGLTYLQVHCRLVIPAHRKVIPSYGHICLAQTQGCGAGHSGESRIEIGFNLSAEFCVSRLVTAHVHS